MTLPSQLGRYRILRALGSGAMGDVYLAEDPQIERRLAIKTVRLEGADQDELAARRARLLMEAKAAGQLVHPHVVTLFDAGEDQGVVFLAFEYVEGTDLGKRLAEEPPLSLRQVLEIIAQTAQALAHAHHNGIVHRDIKPGNILLTSDGVAKIGDFGIAKMRDRVSDLTSTGTIIGTPYYMSPEQVRGEALGGASDLFSLGCVLYEVLHRARPFTGSTITTLVYQILHHDPVNAQSIRPDLPTAVVGLLERMLAKDLAARFSSADQLVTEVSRALAELLPAQLDAPAYLSLDSGATRVNTPASVSAGAVPPPPGLPPPPPGLPPLPPSQPPPPVDTQPARAVSATPSSSPASSSSAPPATQSTSGQIGVPASSTGLRRYLWFGAAGCLALALLVAVVSWFAWLKIRDAGTELLAEVGSTLEEGPLPTPGVTFGSPGQLEQEPAESEAEDGLPIEVIEVIVDRPLEDPASSAGTAGQPSARDVAPAPAASPPQRPPTATVRSTSPGPASSETASQRSSSLTDAGAGAGVEEPEDSSARAATVPSSSANDSDDFDETIAFDRELETSTALRFRVQPGDAYVALRAPGDARFVQVGRAEEYDPGKRRARTFDLPQEGTYYLLFRREGLSDQVVRVNARRGSGLTVVAVDLRRGSAAAFGNQATGQEGVTFTGGAPRSQILVDGQRVGQLRQFSNGQALPLEPGNHVLVVVDPRGQKRVFRVDIDPQASERLARILVPAGL